MRCKNKWHILFRQPCVCVTFRVYMWCVGYVIIHSRIFSPADVDSPNGMVRLSISLELFATTDVLYHHWLALYTYIYGSVRVSKYSSCVTEHLYPSKIHSKLHIVYFFFWSSIFVRLLLINYEELVNFPLFFLHWNVFLNLCFEQTNTYLNCHTHLSIINLNCIHSPPPPHSIKPARSECVCSSTCVRMIIIVGQATVVS